MDSNTKEAVGLEKESSNIAILYKALDKECGNCVTKKCGLNTILIVQRNTTLSNRESDIMVVRRAEEKKLLWEMGAG